MANRMTVTELASHCTISGTNMSLEGRWPRKVTSRKTGQAWEIDRFPANRNEKRVRGRSNLRWVYTAKPFDAQPEPPSVSLQPAPVREPDSGQRFAVDDVMVAVVGAVNAINCTALVVLENGRQMDVNVPHDNLSRFATAMISGDSVKLKQVITTVIED